MKYAPGYELPERQQEAMRKAIRLEWISLAYFVTAITALYFTLGQSQAMKAALAEDLLSLLPPIAFLVAAKLRDRPPSEQFPWGLHRAMTVAYLAATLALLAFGTFILIDSVNNLIKGDHPPIGLVEVFETQLWLGWLMLAALAYSTFPAILLGRKKRKLAAELHDKVLFADAKMNQADWLSGSAAMMGVVGIGLGIWFADAVAAIVISLDIIHDGQKYVRQAVFDLVDERPQTYDESKPHPLIDEARELVAQTGWVEEAAVRLREEGHVLTGEVLVVPTDDTDLAARCEDLTKRLLDLDWRIHDIAVAPLASLEDVPEGLAVDGPSGG